MSQETPLHYVATVNGNNVGTFASISEASVAGQQAVAAGIAGHELNKPRVVEVRDTDLCYQVVSKFYV